MTLSERYAERLDSIPNPGGNGCHPALLGAANLGARLDLDPEQIHQDIRAHIPPGGRRVPDREIAAAVPRALADHRRGTTTYRLPVPIVRDGKGTLERITRQARFTEEVELWEHSPVGLFHEPKRDAALFISTMFHPEDLLFIGDRLEAGILGSTIRPCREWVSFFEAGGTAGPFVIVNPLNGQPATKADGEGVTYRGNGNVEDYSHCLVEFDNLDFQTQIRFWSAVKLPIKALVYSGNKSIHAWLDLTTLVPIANAKAWTHHIKNRLFRGMLEPVGADPATAHPARLARLPGVPRAEKEAWQRILWLSPEGDVLCETS